MRGVAWVGRSWWITAPLLVGGLVSLALAREAPGERESLAGLAGVRVVVENLDAEVEREGLRRSTLQTDVEVRLRQVGLRVLTETEWNLLPGSPYLYLRVTTVKAGKEIPLYAVEILLELSQDVMLARKPTIALSARTWRTSWVALVGVMRLDGVRENVRDRVDEFINDYLAANPK